MRKYIEPEYYCDICGKQVRTKCDLFKMDVEHGGLSGCFWHRYDPIDVCNECKTEIVDFVKGMMKQKKDAKKRGEE